MGHSRARHARWILTFVALTACAASAGTGCASPHGGDTVGQASGAVAGSVSLYGFTASGSVSAQTSANWAKYAFDGENTIENNDWGIPQNGQGGSTIFTEVVNGKQAFGWAWNVYNGTNVAVYPEVGYGWSPNANASWGGQPIIPQVGEHKRITTSFDIIGRHSPGGTWDMAYDIWIMPSAHPASVNGGFELMIWLDHDKQGPWETHGPQGVVNLGGVSYQRYTNAGAASWTCLSYINQGAGIYKGRDFNITEVIDDAATKFGIPGNFYVAAIEFGNEAVNGSGMTEILDWSVNIGGSATTPSPGPTPPPHPTTYPVPGKVMASGYGALTGSMQLEACSDVGGGQDVGYASVGGTLDYAIAAATAGSFSADFRVASAQGGGSFDVLVDGAKVDTITVPRTGDWQTWATVHGNAPYAVGAGEHTLRVVVDSAGFNLNWIELSAGGPGPTPPPPPSTSSPPPPPPPPSGALTATPSIESDWGTGYCEQIRVANTSAAATSTWTVTLDPGAATIAQVWNANQAMAGGRVVLTPLSWNGSIAAGSDTDVGFCADVAAGATRVSVVSVTASTP